MYSPSYVHTNTSLHVPQELMNKVSILFSLLTRGPSWLLPSDSAPVLQYGSGPFCDFLAKIFGVHTPPFLWKMQFYFPLSSLLLHTFVKCSIFILSAIAQVVVYFLTVWLIHVTFSSSFLNYRVYHGYGGHQVYLFLGLCIYLFSFFLYSHSKERGTQFVSQRVMTEIKLLLLYVTPFQNVSLTIWPKAFIFLCKGLFCFILPRWQSPRQSLCVQLFGKFHFVRATPSTGNNKDIISCLSVGLPPWNNKTNLCIRIWKLLVRLSMRHSEKVLCYNNNN
jgi:hypothetical protein